MIRFQLALCVAVLSAVPTFASQDVGVNVHLPATNPTDPVPILDRAVEMRLSWGRMDFRWDFVEPNPVDDVATQGNWVVMDSTVAALHDRGMQILAIIQGPAGWATTGGVEDSPLNTTGQDHYIRFVRAVAERYKGVIDHYEIFNEPNLGANWPNKVDVYVDQLLIPAREVMKSVDSSIQVLGPVLANNMVATIKLETFVQQLGKRQKTYTASTGQKFFDEISQHVYATTAQGVVDDLTKGRAWCLWIFCFQTREPILKIYSENGFDEPLFLTEFGWVASHDPADQDKQGQLLVDTINKLNQVPQLQVGFIYEIEDDPRSTGSDYGLLFSDGTPKSAYTYLKNR
jgi:hypothetical protein